MQWGKAGIFALLSFGFWLAIYNHLEPFSSYLTYSLFAVKKGSPLGDAVQFFLYDPKVMMLLNLIVFVIKLSK